MQISRTLFLRLRRTEEDSGRKASLLLLVIPTEPQATEESSLPLLRVQV